MGKILDGKIFKLNEEEYNLLKGVFIEYRKQLVSEMLNSTDRVVMPYYNLAYSKLIDLIKKFDCYEEWMAND